MHNGEYAECPHCGKIAFGHSEIEEEFGYRYNGTVPQSWCRQCRATERREKTVVIHCVNGTVKRIAVLDLIAHAKTINITTD